MPTKTIRAVERAIDALDVIRDHGGSAGVSVISRQLNLPKSTVHRLLVALSNKAIVRQDARTDLYSFGYKTFELAFAASKSGMTSIAVPYLEELRDRLGETATLGLKIGMKFADIAYAPSLSTLRWAPMLGVQVPLHWGAMGKAILAFVSDEDLEGYLRAAQPIPPTQRTISDPSELLAELTRIRSVGYAVSFGEHEEGAAAVAAPIRSRFGYAYAAACTVGPERRIRQLDIAKAGAIIADVSRKIETACQVAGVIES
jgi:DNA-binding IclR family transcriptional regulator